MRAWKFAHVVVCKQTYAHISPLHIWTRSAKFRRKLYAIASGSRKDIGALNHAGYRCSSSIYLVLAPSKPGCYFLQTRLANFRKGTSPRSLSVLLSYANGALISGSTPCPRPVAPLMSRFQTHDRGSCCEMTQRSPTMYGVKVTLPNTPPSHDIHFFNS
jgi:hypothetical protein